LAEDEGALLQAHYCCSEDENDTIFDIGKISQHVVIERANIINFSEHQNQPLSNMKSARKIGPATMFMDQSNLF